MYKTVIFDLDGTLLNTVPDIRAVLNSTLRSFNLPPVSEEQTKRFVGNGALALVERASGLDGERLQEVYAHYVEHFAACNNELSKYYDGECEVLSRFKDAGVKLAIVTNKPQRATLKVYEKFFSKYNFFFVQGQDRGVALKPAPDAVLSAISKSGQNKCDCLFVGDGETDVLTAKNAGIDCASVLWGYRDKAALQSVGATLFVNSYQELERLILN